MTNRKTDRIKRNGHGAKNSCDIFLLLEECIEELRDCGQEKTAASYITAYNSFARFMGKSRLETSEMTPATLKKYENWLRGNGLTYNTTSCYMRVLRAVYNRAVKRSGGRRDDLFDHVFTGVESTLKRSVDRNVIRRLQQLPLEDNAELALARDLFMFSFYTRGMPFVDMAYLSKSNVVNGYIVYNRHKTTRKLFIKIERCVTEIIERYASGVQGDFLLPILKKSQSYESALRSYNQRLSVLSSMMDLPQPLSSYVARHTWASMAYHNGIALSVISQSMGHTDEKTTRIYLASLDQKVIDDANARLIQNIRK